MGDQEVSDIQNVDSEMYGYITEVETPPPPPKKPSVGGELLLVRWLVQVKPLLSLCGGQMTSLRDRAGLVRAETLIKKGQELCA